MRTSAGSISPAERCTISPTTSSSIGISAFSCSLRVTVQVVVIIFSSFSAALPLLDSCTKRSTPEISTIVTIMTTVNGSKSSGSLPKSDKYGNTISVMVDTSARQKRIAVKGFTKASVSRLANDFLFSRVTLLLPYLLRLIATASASRPRKVVCRLFKISCIGFVAANCRRRFCSSRITVLAAV